MSLLPPGLPASFFAFCELGLSQSVSDFGLPGLGAQGTAWIGSLVAHLALQRTSSSRSAVS